MTVIVEFGYLRMHVPFEENLKELSSRMDPVGREASSHHDSEWPVAEYQSAHPYRLQNRLQRCDGKTRIAVYLVEKIGWEERIGTSDPLLTLKLTGGWLRENVFFLGFGVVFPARASIPRLPELRSFRKRGSLA